MNNRKHNSTNHNQGTAKRVLCVCSAGLLRSPTLAVVLQRAFGHNTRSAGSHAGFALIPVDEVLLHWADEVVFVNKENFETTNSLFKEELLNTSVIVLNIPDVFPYMHPDLQEACLTQYNAAQE